MTFSGKTVVVTGGAGFIGSHLCRALTEKGARVISLDNYFTGSRDNHHDGVEYREGHTKDIERLVPEAPDVLFHLGEYARVEQSVLDPEIVHDLNVAGTEGVLAFWRARKCKLVYAGSSTKFGDEGRFREKTPYAATKARNTERVKEIGDTERLPYAITYFYNVYGPGERAGEYGTVVEMFKHMYLSGAPITVTAPGTQTRHFTHIDDIVEGLLLVGERGSGDEHGLGSDRAFTLLELAHLFGSDIVMLPERMGNRMSSRLDTSKARSLGWEPRHSLEAYVEEFVRTHARGAVREKRILVFSTTFFPIVGPAEQALEALMERMPDVQFDIVTTRFSREAAPAFRLPNVAIHRVGRGRSWDKYLLPILGFVKARALLKSHRYLFGWSLMASYAALLGILVRRTSHLPLLVTLADHDLAAVPSLKRFAIKHLLSDADQVYGIDVAQEGQAEEITNRRLARRSIGEGDAFANQIRYSYAETLLRLQGRL